MVSFNSYGKLPEAMVDVLVHLGPWLSNLTKICGPFLPREKKTRSNIGNPREMMRKTKNSKNHVFFRPKKIEQPGFFPSGFCPHSPMEIAHPIERWPFFSPILQRPRVFMARASPVSGFSGAYGTQKKTCRMTKLWGVQWGYPNRHNRLLGENMESSMNIWMRTGGYPYFWKPPYWEMDPKPLMILYCHVHWSVVFSVSDKAD